VNDQDSPTVRAPQGASPPAQLEALLAAWIGAQGAGDGPSLQHFLAQLATKAEREQFVDLVDQLNFAERNLPLRLREHLVMGGRYELLAPIGSGGMGQVWRALDRKLGHEVAVKVLSLAATAALDLDRLVEREGKLLAKLSHPGIVRIQDSGRDGEHRFLVMELVGGLPLDDLIEQAIERRTQRHETMDASAVLALTGPALPGRTAVLDGTEPWVVAVTKIVVALLRTLEAAHGAGVVHRDLKPGNVRLANGAFPVLLDFGISIDASAAPGTLTASMFGTAQYSAPEQWDSTAVVGVHTDVYQAGLVLYELLTLQRCFHTSSPIETMQAVRAARYPRPRQITSSIDRGLEACVLRAMDVDPAHRYRSAAEMRADLERFLAGQVPFAARGFAMASHRARAALRRSRPTLSFAAAVLVGAAGFWLLRGETSIAVAFVLDQDEAIDLDAKEKNLVLMTLAKRGPEGQWLLAPARIGVGEAPRRGNIRALEVPAGTTRLVVASVGDPPDGPDAEIVLRTVAANPDDAEEVGVMAKWEQAMELARATIERRNGDWLTQAEWKQLFDGGRGSAGLQVTDEQLFGDEPWEAGGLSGIVVKKPLGKR